MLKTVLRDTGWQLADATGLSGAVARSTWRSRRLLILCYHGFAQADEHLWNPELYMTAATFRRRLEIIRSRGYTVLNLGEALERLSGADLPPRSVAITVDDGGRDFLTAGYPVIQAAQVPVTIYVSSYHVFDRRPVFNVCSNYLIWDASRRGQRDISPQPWCPSGVEIGSPRSRQTAVGLLHTYARSGGLSASQKQQLLVELASQLGSDYEKIESGQLFYLMAPEEIRNLDHKLVDVQLHTHRHRMPFDRDLLLREIEDNRVALELCGIPRTALSHFCYPSGVYDARVLPWLNEIGIRSAVTCVPGLANAKSERLLLPRFVDNQLVPEAVFSAWLSGIPQLRPGRKAP